MGSPYMEVPQTQATQGLGAARRYAASGATHCDACDNGKYRTEAMGAVECADCTAGSETVDLEGAFAETGATACTACVNGRFRCLPRPVMRVLAPT